MDWKKNQRERRMNNAFASSKLERDSFGIGRNWFSKIGENVFKISPAIADSKVSKEKMDLLPLYLKNSLCLKQVIFEEGTLL
jgi:hypothetical protein